MRLSLFDLHCDTAGEMLSQQQQLKTNHLAVSIDRAAVFEQYIQVMAFWTLHRLSDEEGWQRLLAMHQNLVGDPAVTGGLATVCRSVPPRAYGNSLLLAIEDARLLAGKLDRVEELAKLGIRILTPLWSGQTCIGGSHDTDSGLTDFGKNAMRQAMEYGMILDISHASEASAEDIFSLASDANRPVIASHSNAYSICPVTRNLRAGQLQSLLASGGVVGLNLYTRFLKREGSAELTDILRHIEYFLENGAERALCFGCDMDGADLLPEIPNVAALAKLGDFLTQYYSDDVIHAIFFENAYQFAQRYLQPTAINP